MVTSSIQKVMEYAAGEHNFLNIFNVQVDSFLEDLESSSQDSEHIFDDSPASRQTIIENSPLMVELLMAIGFHNILA